MSITPVALDKCCFVGTRPGMKPGRFEPMSVQAHRFEIL
jgi:hypothetical protein